MQTKYSTKDICGALFIGRNTMQDLMDRGYITPSIHKSTKQGDSNIFSLEDLRHAVRFSLLTKTGVSRRMAAEIAKDKVRYNIILKHLEYFYIKLGRKGV